MKICYWDSVACCQKERDATQVEIDEIVSRKSFSEKNFANDAIKQQITALESTITDRRYREAILGTDNGWLANIDAQIAVLRAQLK